MVCETACGVDFGIDPVFGVLCVLWLFVDLLAGAAGVLDSGHVSGAETVKWGGVMRRVSVDWADAYSRYRLAPQAAF